MKNKNVYFFDSTIKKFVTSATQKIIQKDLRLPVKKNANVNQSSFERLYGKRFKHLNLEGEIKKIDLPNGSFNGCIINNIFDENGFICAFRISADSISLCRLDKKFNVIPLTIFNLNLNHATDPRLIWTEKNELLMIYSYHENNVEEEHIVGTIVMNDKNNFIKGARERISPPTLKSRQKNWVPFKYGKEIYFVAEVNPHRIYKMNSDKLDCAELVYSCEWRSKWFNKEHMRGSSSPILIDEETYLGTFHTAEKKNNISFYDNGFYTFKASPPFNILSCSSTPFLSAESAQEKRIRSTNIVCPFVVGMIKNGDSVHISYGDNDSAAKVLTVSLSELKDYLHIK
jgi:predicted GH43/DUF377 family glycosyl hydrolase